MKDIKNITYKNNLKLFLENKKRMAFLFFEKIDIKYYNLLQIDVLTKIAEVLGFKKFNDFTSSPYGDKSMKLFRKITFDVFGSSLDDPKIPNINKIKEIYYSPQKNTIVNKISFEILNML